jgi:hypothetical protein
MVGYMCMVARRKGARRGFPRRHCHGRGRAHVMWYRRLRSRGNGGGCDGGGRRGDRRSRGWSRAHGNRRWLRRHGWDILWDSALQQRGIQHITRLVIDAEANECFAPQKGDVPINPTYFPYTRINGLQRTNNMRIPGVQTRLYSRYVELCPNRRRWKILPKRPWDSMYPHPWHQCL